MSQQAIAASKTMQLFMLRISKGNDYQLAKYPSPAAKTNECDDSHLQLAEALSVAADIDIHYGGCSWRWRKQNAAF